MKNRPEFVRTTVLAVRRDENVVLAGDGQVTLDRSVIKGGASWARPPCRPKACYGSGTVSSPLTKSGDEGRREIFETKGVERRAMLDLSVKFHNALIRKIPPGIRVATSPTGC